MSAAVVLSEVTAAGGQLWAKPNGKLGYRLPPEAARLLDRVRAHKAGLLELLAGQPPNMPPGLALTRWAPLSAPVTLGPCETVTNMDGFIRSEIASLAAKLRSPRMLTGRTVAAHLGRLRAVGVFLELLQ